MSWFKIVCPYCRKKIPLSSIRCPLCRTVIPHECGEIERRRILLFFTGGAALVFILFFTLLVWLVFYL